MGTVKVRKIVIEGKADVIINRDDHLQALSSSPVPIFSVAEFLKRRERGKD